MNGAVLVGLAPWLVIVVAVRTSGVSPALGALLAAVTAGLTVLRARRQRTPATFETASFLTFAAMTLGAWVAPRSAGADLDHYGRAITAGAMAAIALASLAMRPITVQFTRDLVPGRVLATRAFIRANRIDTAVWAGTALAVTASFLIASGLHSPSDKTAFNWLVPLALSVGCVRLLARRWAALDALDETASLVVAALEVPRAAGGHVPGEAGSRRPLAHLRLVRDERAERRA